MVIDSSAIAAILLKEPSESALLTAIFGSRPRLISVASILEVSITMTSRKRTWEERHLDSIVTDLGTQVMPIDQDQVALAREAFRRFGKGRHPAALNFGDCFSYALARHTDEPLLFVGSDFSKTDIAAAEWA